GSALQRDCPKHDYILSKPLPAAMKPPATRRDSIAPCCSIGATPGPLVLMPPAISISRAEPPGLVLRAMAERLIRTPLTNDGPVPPNVSTPRRTTSRPI